MEADRKHSKGSLFNLFDWNGESRKKLFVSNPDSPEASELGKESVANAANSQPQMVNDRRACSTTNCSSDFSCASSVTSDEGYGTRVPGVVARLMGLDALPTSSNCEQSSALLSNCDLLRVAQYGGNISHLRGEYNHMDYLNAYSKHESYSWESIEPRPHKVHSRPIERFQTEVLPPKSAKSIPITSHKLLSPIRSPRFIPTKNVAHIMEAAAKIIEASPRATNSKVPSTASSIPVRIQDLKQKMEAAQTASRLQRLGTPGTAKSKRGWIGSKMQNGSEGMSSSKASMFSAKGASNRVMKNGISVSPAPRSKVIEQRRDGSSSGSINITKKKDRNAVGSNAMIPRLPGNERNPPKKSSERVSTNVLQKNNQKQNVITNKDGLSSKHSAPHQQGRKAQPNSVFMGPNRKVNKMPYKPEMGSKSMGLMVKETAKEKRSMSQKKQSLNDFPVDGSASGIMSFNKDATSIKCDVTVDGFKDIQKNGTDVVSFTFTSPIKSIPSSQTSSCAFEAFDGSDHPCSKSLTSFAGLNLISGDALGALLEQKLRELIEKVESSNCNMIREEASVSTSQSTLVPEVNVSGTPTTNDLLFQLHPSEDNSEQLDKLESFSPKGLQGSLHQKWQQSEEMEDHSRNSDCSEAGEEPECPDPSPVSVLEPLFKTNGGKMTSVCNFNLPAQVGEAFSAISNNETLEVEGGIELPDSAFFISAADLGGKQMTITSTRLKELGDYELKYLRGMLNNAHVLLEDFASGKTSKVVDPSLFDLLENREQEIERNEEEYDKLGRKLLFDCASECLDMVCEQVSFGGCKAWTRLWTLFLGEGWMAEKLYKEILGWKSMEDLMVDELVEKDMSSLYGKWVEFNLEVLEDGVEIEKEFITSLVDEVISDLLLL